MKHLLTHTFHAPVVTFCKDKNAYLFLEKVLHHFHEKKHEVIPLAQTLEAIDGAVILTRTHQLVTAHDRRIELSDYLHKKQLASIVRHQSAISCMVTNSIKSLLYAGSMDGRIYVFSLPSLHYMHMLPSHGDQICALCVTPSLEYIISSGFERKVHVVHRSHLQAPSFSFGVSDVVVSMQCIDDNTLLYALRNGMLYLYDIATQQRLHSFEKMHDSITALAISDDKAIAVVGTKLGYIALYDLKRFEVISTRYLKCSGEITQLQLSTKHYYLDILIQATQWQRFKLLDAENLQSLLESGNYKEVDALLKHNPLLLHHEAIMQLQQQFYVALHEAKTYIEQNMVHKAKALLQPFETLRLFRRIVTSLFRDYEQYIKFANYIKQKRYALAYAMVMSHNELANSKAYERMEKRFEVTFEKAQAVLNEENGEARAQALLKPFRGVTSKVKVISELFKEKKVTDMFLRYLQHRQIVPMMVLCEQHPFLKTHHHYKKLRQHIKTLEDELFTLIESQQYRKAQEKLQEAEPFAPLLPSFKALTQEVQSALALMDAFSKKQWMQAYTILEQHPHLHTINVAMQLEEQYYRQLNNALDAALRGDIAHIVKRLSAFFHLKSKGDEIREIFKNGYITQLSLMIEERNLVELGLKNYLYLFGYDESIEHFLEAYSEFSLVVEDNTGKEPISIALNKLPLRIETFHDSY